MAVKNDPPTFTEQRIREAERIIAADRAEFEETKKQFFIQEPNDRADGPPLAPVRPPPRKATTSLDHSRKTIKAIRAFVRAANEMEPRDRDATIRWLVDRYLGADAREALERFRRTESSKSDDAVAGTAG
jgi:hypothetical protein